LDLKVKQLEEQITKERIDFEHKVAVIRMENDREILALQKINDDLMANK